MARKTVDDLKFKKKGCGHVEEGWCLDCVEQLWNEKEAFIDDYCSYVDNAIRHSEEVKMEASRMGESLGRRDARKGRSIDDNPFEKTFHEVMHNGYDYGMKVEGYKMFKEGEAKANG